MTYKSYANKKTAPQRISRKRLRRDVFMYNKKLAKNVRKQKRENVAVEEE